jgi:hypothetical protein
MRILISLLLLYCFPIFCSDKAEKNPTTTVIEGKLCIPYNQLCTVDELGPYKEPCLAAFGAKEPKDKNTLLELWIAIKAFSDESRDWHYCGLEQINEKSTDLNKSFPAYIPLHLLLSADYSKPLILNLFINNKSFIVQLKFDQKNYSKKRPFDHPTTILHRIMMRHKMFHKIQAERSKKYRDLEKEHRPTRLGSQLGSQLSTSPRLNAPIL